MTLVRTVIHEISQAEGNITADDIVNSVIDKMCASGSTQAACDDIRERLIGIALCALNVMPRLGHFQSRCYLNIDYRRDPIHHVDDNSGPA